MSLSSHSHPALSLLTPRGQQMFFKALRETALEMKMWNVIRKVSNFKAQGRRVLVYVRDDEAARFTNEMMRQAGIKSVDFCSMRSTERATSLWKFNDPEQSEIDAFITLFGLGAGGGNFYGACHTGIMLQYPDGIGTMLAAQHSFRHIGMTHIPTWAFVHMDNSFDEHEQCQIAHQEAKLIAEMSPLEYEEMTDFKVPEIPQSITGQHRLICAHEILCRKRKYMASCYPRLRMHWPNMTKPEAMTEGEFYAAVGRFLMANPSATHLFTKATMERIASTWEPGTELSMARIVGNCPALPNGVKIYNFVEPGKGDDML